MSACVVCCKNFNSISKPQKCRKCGKLVHKTNCATFVKSGNKENGSEVSISYICKICQPSEVKVHVEDTSIMDALLGEMKSLREDVKGLGGKMDMMNSKLDTLDKKILELEARQFEAEETIAGVQDSIKDTHKRINNLADYNRRNCLEIHGIPEETNEDLMDIVTSLGKHLGLTIDINHMDALPHRLPARYGIRPIIVRFVNRWRRDVFMNSKKGKKPSTSDLGFEGDKQPIYINDNLTPEKKYLAMKTRMKFKNSECQVWTMSSGKIFVAKKGTKGKYLITDDKDLDTASRNLLG